MKTTLVAAITLLPLSLASAFTLAHPGSYSAESATVAPGPQGPPPKIVDCGKEAGLKFGATAIGVGKGPTAQAANSAANLDLEKKMLGWAKGTVECGECEDPDACFLKPIYEAKDVFELGPTLQPDGTWIKVNYFDAAFQVMCTDCD